MITKNQKVKGSVIKVLLTLPVFALLILLNTQCDNVKPNEDKQQTPAAENKAEGEVGNLAGRIIFSDEKPFPCANVALEKDGKVVYSVTADENGNYEFKSIPAGTYNLKTFYEGYTTMIIEGFNIPANKFAFQNLYLLKQDDADETSSQKPQVTQDSIYRVSDAMPEYPGGPNEMMKYIQENIKYPQSAIDNKIEGRVFVTFVVEKDGSISNAAVMRGIDKECDAEALRVVSSMPKWNPGQHKGEVVRTQFTIPIIYKFNN